ncbi:MAG TPA: arsenic transporter [Bryobacteraceae bacterium]|jgi:arsenical pump membrane protein
MSELQMHWQPAAVWVISLASISLVLIRPKGWSEAWWSSAGAGALALLGLVPATAAAQAIGKGTDVYLFLAGMMVISELARREGVFDWVAGHAVRASGGSQTRLFLLIYCVGVVVTVLLSNDATAVVLTPAVQAAVKAAKAEPLPYLLICAFIANAASFVLPISNPANLVVYGKSMPPLGHWLATFTLPSLCSVVATFVVLRWRANKLVKGTVETNLGGPHLSRSGKMTLYGIGVLAVTLMTASGLGMDLGAPACIAGLVVAAVVSLGDRDVPRDIANEVTWSVIPLVAGLFVIVEALNRAGAQHAAVSALESLENWQPLSAAMSSAFGIAIVSNVMNNLPSGLIGGAAVKAAQAPGLLRSAVLLGVDLGPNLSVTGSLATILWLIAIRREGQTVGFWRFLKWGILIMPPALALSVLALMFVPRH